MTGDAWVSLFSGGKDSSWALYRALEEDIPVERLLTVHPQEESYMYHVPATEVTPLAAESVGIRHVAVRPPDHAVGTADDAATRGDRELEPLETALGDLADTLGGIAGLTVGAVESEFQTSRIRAVADRLDAELFAPLWRGDPRSIADRMLAAGFDIRVVQVAAAGFDETWLGRRLDREALSELETLNAAHGVHLLGEGGEFETLVTDGPHMRRPIELTYERVWEGDRGTLRITDARLGDERPE